MIERTICILAAAMLLPGCSPTYNWREVMLEGALVKLMLPCKPDSGKRELPLVHGQRNWVHMVGCETGGLTFAFAWADVKQVASTSSAVTTWQRATLEQLKVNARTEQPITISGVGAQQAATLVRIEGTTSAGVPVMVKGMWFAKGSFVFQALVLGDKITEQVSEPFFSGVTLL